MVFDIIMIAIIAIIAFSCKRKGIIKCVMGLISTVLAVVLTCVFRQPAIDMIKKVNFYEKVYKSIGEKVTQNINMGNTGILNTLAGDAITKGTEAITDSVISSLLSIVLSVFLFIIIMLVLRVFTNAMSSVAKLPILNFINSMCGLIWGAVLGMALFYAIFGVWAYYTSYQIPMMLNNSALAKSMFETNLLLMIFS